MYFTFAEPERDGNEELQDRQETSSGGGRETKYQVGSLLVFCRMDKGHGFKKSLDTESRAIAAPQSCSRELE